MFLGSERGKNDTECSTHPAPFRLPRFPIIPRNIAKRTKRHRGLQRRSEDQICFRNADDLFWRYVRISRAWSWSYFCYRLPNFPAFGAVRIFITTSGSKEQRKDEKRKKFHERFEGHDIQFGPQLQSFYLEFISVEAGSTHSLNRVKLLLRQHHYRKARVSDQRNVFK